MEDKRIHQRYEIIHGVGHPTQFNLIKDGVPGVIIDLSAGGIALHTQLSYDVGKKLRFVINVPGLATHEIEGKVEFCMPDNGEWHVGVSFTKIEQEDMDRINKMATDYNDCKKKIAIGAENACTKECSYSPLCSNPVKIKGLE